MFFLRKYTNIFIFVLIIFLASVLRLYKLGEVPGSLDWDEASIGWNAWSILKTGTDEYGKAWPVSIRSFNDYKPPLYVYAAIPSMAIFGKTEFAVRLPSAFAGILTVAITFFLVKELTKNHLFSVLCSLLLAISPWAIQFSRVAFEANLALLFFVAGATLLVYFINRQKNIFLLSSFFFFIFSIYSYHSPRLVIPIFLLGIFFWYREIFLKNFKALLFSVFCSLLFLYPLARNTWHVRSVQARFSEVSIFKTSSDPTEIVKRYGKNYLDHFNPDFLFLQGDKNARHHAPDIGQLLLIEFPFLLAGFYYLVKNRPAWGPFVLIWFFAAPAASAITMSTPHAVRSLLLLPTLQIVTAYGFFKIYKIILPFAFCLLTLNAMFYIHQYFIHLNSEYAKDWQYGYKQAVGKVLGLENNYDRIYFTKFYDQAYIYFLFYGRIDPVVKNSGYFYQGLDKYDFDVSKNDPGGLYVFAPEDKKDNIEIFDRIYFPDGKEAFLFGRMKS